MIAVKCPHCRIGLKIDESKIPAGILSFKCPKCKEEIPIAYLNGKSGREEDSETVVISSRTKDGNMGRLTVLPDIDTPQQMFQLNEGVMVIGRKAQASSANICIQTADKTMSRSHIRIEVKKNPKGKGFLHCLSDNNSKNHTLYNGKCIEEGDVIVLNDNDEIVMGRTTIRFNE